MKGVKRVALRFSMVADNVRCGLTQRQAACQCCIVARLSLTEYLAKIGGWPTDTFCSAVCSDCLAQLLHSLRLYRPMRDAHISRKTVLFVTQQNLPNTRSACKGTPRKFPLQVNRLKMRPLSLFREGKQLIAQTIALEENSTTENLRCWNFRDL